MWRWRAKQKRPLAISVRGETPFRSIGGSIGVDGRGDLDSTSHPTFWFHRERFGNPSASYVAVDPEQTEDHWPNIPGRLTCEVCYERLVWAVFRRVRKTWIAPTGSYCQILGRWDDGTVRLQLGLPDTKYPDRKLSIDGRFPDWVVEPVKQRPILPSNLEPSRKRSITRAVVPITLIVIVIAAAYVANRPEAGLPQVANRLEAASPQVASPVLLTPRTTSDLTRTPTAIPLATVVSQRTSEPNPAADAGNSPVVRVANTGGVGVFIRHSPAMADRVRAYPDGTLFRVVGPNVEGDGVEWHHVAAPDGLEGYVPTQYAVDEP